MIKTSTKAILILIATALGLVLVFSIASAQPPSSVTLAWDANPETNVTSYVLRWSTNSMAQQGPGLPSAFTWSATLGPVTNHTVTGLSPGLSYWFSVAAVSSGGEGEQSAEATYRVPASTGPAPKAPLKFRKEAFP